MVVVRIRAILLAGILAVVPTQAHAFAPTQSTAARVDPNQLLQAFNAAWDASDYATAVEAGDPLVAMPVFQQQTDGLQYSVLTRLGIAHQRLDHVERALVLWDRAEAVTDAPGFLNYVRVYAYRQTEAWAQSASCFTLLAVQNEELFDAIQLSVIFSILNGLADAGDTAREDALLELVLAEYDPESPYTTLDYIRLRLARSRAREGDADAALALVQQITHASALASVRTERVFEPIWLTDGFEQMTDIRAAFEQELAAARAQAADQPAAIEPLSNAVRILLSLDRAEEADRLARSVDARLHDGEEFQDGADQTPWLLNHWAYALYALGRLDDADDVMRRAAGFSEGESANVSQTINLAEMLFYQRRYAEVLETLEVMADRPASPYGDMWVWASRACAHHALGDFTARDAELALLEAHWTDNAAAYQKATLCVGDMEAAADLLVRRLADPAHAPLALSALQGYRPAFTAPGMELSRELAAQLDALAGRDEVAAALEAVGRVEESDLIDAYWGNF